MNCVSKYSLETGLEVKMEVVAKEKAVIPFTHPLVKTTRSIMSEAGITPAVDPSTGDLNSIILAGHPGVTLGLTKLKICEKQMNLSDSEPLYSGIAQMITLLRAIDQGLCES